MTVNNGRQEEAINNLLRCPIALDHLKQEYESAIVVAGLQDEISLS